jgi:chromosomal replication initiation ATPase DnaA
MTRPGQLVLDLAHAPVYAAADFLSAPCNRDARARIESWPAWSDFGLVLWGPEGSGKTHLAHLFRDRTGGILVPAAALVVDDVPALARYATVAVEDSDRGVGERALLHLHNLLRENGRSLLLTGRAPPSRWPVALPDLRSRLAALPIAAIGSPDDSLLEAVLFKLFADRQVRVGAEVVGFVLARMERSFAAARTLVAAIDAAALAQGRPVTVPLVRAVMGLEERREDGGDGA